MDNRTNRLIGIVHSVLSGTEMTGESLRDAGMQRAIDKADAVVPDWSETAYAWLQRMAVKHPQRRFTTEEIRGASLFYDIPLQAEARAWGALMVKALRAGLIAQTGEWRKCGNPKGHKRDVRLWRFV